ncbi:tripartite tricarboxylate transporter TctB family protein [Psychromonas sp. KJ10-10]|uniref:tripartite tricarboxylate transporter TctB family protein n=1 Tax=Psychromonas sp. KJ10-10 TaxID=3391823 RepID=UPI0039B5A45D
MRYFFSLSSLILSLAFTIYGVLTLNLFDFNGRPGAGFFPLLIGIGLVVFTGYNVYKDKKIMATNKADDDVNQNISESKVYAKDTLVVAVLITLLIAILNTIGALLSMVLFMVAFLAYFNPGKKTQNIIYSIAFPAFIYLLFDVWLNAGLPDGLLSYFY